VSVQFTEADEHLLSMLEVSIERGLEDQLVADWQAKMCDYLGRLYWLLEEAPPESEMTEEERANMALLAERHEQLTALITRLMED
jgi:hypothetical protein